MAKKAELLEKAAELKLDVSEKNTIAEIEEAIAGAEKHEVREAVVAKAGKRSQKSLDEAEEKAEKEARKEAGDTTPQGDAVAHEKKGPAPKVRPMIERRGKNYRKAAEKVDTTKVYSLADALALAVETNPVKFDASVELHIRLGVDPRQADQNIRATVALPNGTGKKIRVAVFAPEADAAKATKAGADIAGDDDFLKALDKGEINFDVLIATPAYMPKLGKYARLLGPKGLMPNPKSGTVAADVAKAVTEAKAGKVEYRVDKTGVIHSPVGKVSFDPAKLQENTRVLINAVMKAKPTTAKGRYLKKINLAATMSPGVLLDELAYV